MQVDILAVNKERSFNEIAVVMVRYYDMALRCKLVVGYDKIKDSTYHYLLMPFVRLKANGEDKMVRVNVVNWPNEVISKQFQTTCLEILRKRHPDLFTVSKEQAKGYTEEKIKNAKQRRSHDKQKGQTRNPVDKRGCVHV